jgi:two-component system chemotaxis response regulator CheY
MRTLIVDDEAACRRTLSLALAAQGPVIEAESGRTAIQAVKEALIRRQPFDFITLDIIMGDMDGHAALVAIRAMEEIAGIQPGNGAIVLMTSSLDDGQTIISSFREQCSGYLTKPVEFPKLFAALQEHGLIAR